MTRLSSYPFAKSLLALSLSAVFSTATLAATTSPLANDNFSVEVNGHIQSTPHVTGNPLSIDNSWWGVDSMTQGNTIQISTSAQASDPATLDGDIFGGWSSKGTIANNQILINVERGSLLLSNDIIGGFTNLSADATVENNLLDISGISLISDVDVVRGKQLRTLIAGGLALSEEQSIGASALSVSNNHVMISDSDLQKAVVTGGFIAGNQFDVGKANKNIVTLDKVSTSEDEPSLIIMGGASFGGLNNQANNNEVTITDSTSAFVLAGLAGGIESQANGNKLLIENSTIRNEYSLNVAGLAGDIVGAHALGIVSQANNNVVTLNNVSSAMVIGAVARDTGFYGEDESLGFAQANDNQFLWSNEDDFGSFDLNTLIIAGAISSSGNAEVLRNTAEIIGLKTTEMGNSGIRTYGQERYGYVRKISFSALSDEGDAVLSENSLKIESSEIWDEMTAGVASGNNVVMSDNDFEVVNSQIEELGGYVALAYDNAKVIGNSIVANQLTANSFVGLNVASRSSEISGNKIFINSSKIAGLIGIMVESGFF